MRSCYLLIGGPLAVMTLLYRAGWIRPDFRIEPQARAERFAYPGLTGRGSWLWILTFVRMTGVSQSRNWCEAFSRS